MFGLYIELHDCLFSSIHVLVLVFMSLLLTMAVGRMDAMAACCGRSWMVSRRRAGYMPSLRDM